MTWIRVVPFDEDETLPHARAAHQKLYPIQYAEPTHPQYKDHEGIVGSHSLFPDVMYHGVCGVRGADVSRPASDVASARNDHDGGVGCQAEKALMALT